MSPHRSRRQSERSHCRSRSRSLVIRLAAPVQLERPSMAGLFPRLLTQSPPSSSLRRRAARRHPINCCGVNPCRRATAHTVSRPRNDSARRRPEPVNTSSRRIGSGLFFKVRTSHFGTFPQPLFSSFDQATVPSSLRTSAWRTLRRQARAMRRNGLHIARLSRGIRVCNRRAMGRQPRRASQG